MDSQHPLSPDGFDALIGLELADCSDELVRARLPVRDELKSPAAGALHGGVYAVIAEALSCRGTASALAGGDKVAVGLANHTTVLSLVASGAIHATAIPRHRGRTTWVWEVEMADDRDQVCARSRVTVAVRDG
jgi:1,4-dihydroxy-2-naphthoyl-CoA hydrolase